MNMLPMNGAEGGYKVTVGNRIDTKRLSNFTYIFADCLSIIQAMDL